MSSKKNKDTALQTAAETKAENKAEKKKDKKPGKKLTLKKKKRFSLGGLFENDKFMLAFSLVIAFFIWTSMSMSNGETVNYPVTSIPVTMELSEDAKGDNLSVVTIDGIPLDEFEATVKVKGNSVTVGSLKPSDIQVYGSNLGNIVGSGTYNVTLLARQLGVKNNYDIVSVTPSEVKVVVDRNITTELTIESLINASSPVEYYIGAASLSQQSVTVSGPEQSVSKAVKAVVSTDVDKELQETTTLTNLDVKLLDSDGNEIYDDSITLSPAEVDATIPVLVKKTVPLTLEYINAPPGFDGESLVKLEPAEIEVAAAADKIDSVSSISAGTIDLSTISYGMTAMSTSIVMPEGVRNLNNIETATASFDFSGYSTKSFVLTNFNPLNLAPGLTAEQTSYGRVNVRVIGPKNEIAELTSDNITATVDLDGVKVGTTVMPVTVRVDNSSTSWVYGNYTMNITVKDASEVDVTASSSSASSSAASSSSVSSSAASSS